MTETERPDPGRGPAWIGPALRLLLRLAVIGAVAYGAHLLIGYAMDLAHRLPAAEAETMVSAMILSALVVYALLIAVPFVPGVEIGLALLLMRGASIAPEVYLATLAGLSLAFCVGRFLSDSALPRTLSDLRLRQAAAFAEHVAAMTPAERQAAIAERLPSWLALPLVRYRYLTLAVLLNLPGNAFMGGGGGLMMAAGISRLFDIKTTFLTIAVAVLPVPLMIWWLGPGLLA